jgi:hypothetical protein
MSATRLAERAGGRLRAVERTSSWTPRPVEICRASMSASGLESAKAGIGRTPSAKRVLPVCARRLFEVPIERITTATAPRSAATEGPRLRRGTAWP